MNRLAKRYLLNLFYVISIIIYALIVGYIFSKGLNLEKGKNTMLSAGELGLVVGAVLSLIVATIFAY